MVELADLQNESPNVERRLAAVVFADVAGYTRLMALDDVDTVNKWKLLRTEIMMPHMERYGGCIADRAGDALLLEFKSAVSAVGWAIDVQRTIHSQHEKLAPVSVRISVNVDDVIDDDGILQGDGVNIAARIHQAAEPGQIVMTAAVRDYVMNRMPLMLHDLGTPPLKNVDRPVRVFAVAWPEATDREIAHQPYLQWSTRPTVAVLPFRNIGGSADDNYFGEGITEDIITGLSRSRYFYVIARTSTLRYRERTEDLRQIARELDVRYILDGSVRRRDARLRINAELIDVAANRQIWAERFDGFGDDVFEFQDRIVASIVGSLEPQLRAVEVNRVRGRPTESLDAYDCVLKALSRLYLFTDESYRETEELLERAIALDPSYAQAYVYAAWRLNFYVGESRSPDPETDKLRALEYSRLAVELDPEDATALAVAGHILAFSGGRPGEAVGFFDSALELDENSAFAWAMSALTFSYLGRADEALERLRNVWRLSPFDPLNFFFWIVAGIAEFVAGRYGEAIAWLRKSKRANPRFIACLRMLAASLALDGNEEGAQAIAQEILAVDQSFRVSTFVAWYPLQQAEDLQRLEAGLRAAGLPE